MKNKYKIVLFALISSLMLGVKVGNINNRQEVVADDYCDSTDAPVNYFEDTLPKRIVANFGEDASSQMLVTWQINKSVNDQYLLIAPYVDVTYSTALKIDATITKWEMVDEEYPFATHLERNLCRVEVDDLLELPTNGIVILSKFPQPENAPSPILVTLVGTIISVNPSQL